MIYLCEEEFKNKTKDHFNNYDRELTKEQTYYLIMLYSFNSEKLYSFIENNYTNKYTEDNDKDSSYNIDINFTPDRYKQIEFNNKSQGFRVADDKLSGNDDKYYDIISMGII